MEQRLTIITLGVANVHKATQFYESRFGWEKSTFSNEHITFFVLNGMQLALYERKKLAEDAQVPSKGDGFKGYTLAYNTKSEKEVDTLIKKLGQSGVTVVKEPQKTDWGGYSGYISDPDGHLWEIAYNPFMDLG